jgi:large subunit ribosomal protein L28
MARVCDLNGIKSFSGNKVSHSNIKTRTKWLPNLKDKRYTIPELARTVTLKLSTRAIRTIDKLGGISQAIMAQKDEKMSPKTLKLKADIKKARKLLSGAAKTPVAATASVATTTSAAPKAAKTAKPAAAKATKKA